ncbi:MAG: phosphatase PAP2 family protein [Bryobacteraceae bacterium]|jgi:membrane-associated phospholipid phosphatase
MRYRALLAIFAALSLGRTLCGQAAGPSPTAPAPQAAPVSASRDVSWARLLPNLASDQKRIWLFPTKVARGRHLLPTLAVLGAAAILIETDAHSAPYFRGTTSFGQFNSIFTSKATEVGTFVAPVTLYAAGWIAKDSYARHTALLAGEAVGDSEILAAVMKDIDRRSRPATYPPHVTMSGSWFNSPGSWLRGRGSFPSGHAIAALSVATVIARRYPRQRWVPYVAYGLAGLVSFSRLTLSAHFPSDVFMGAALGYSISRYAVLRQ